MPTITYDNPVYQPGDEIHFTEFGVTAKNGEPFEAPAELVKLLKDDPHLKSSASTKKDGGDK